MKGIVEKLLNKVVKVIDHCLGNTIELCFSADKNISSISGNDQEFGALVIGSADKPYSGRPRIQLRVNSEIVLDSRQTTPEKVKEYLQKGAPSAVSHLNEFFIYPDPRCLRSQQTWGEKSYIVETYRSDRQSISIIFNSTQILAIRIANFAYKLEKDCLQIKVDGLPWTDFRLDHQTLIELFGEPVSKEKYFTE